MQVVVGLTLTALLVSCNSDSYFDPSKTGLFSNTATTMPVLARLDVIEKREVTQAKIGPPVPADLKPESLEYRISPGDILRITAFDLAVTPGGEEVLRHVDQSGLVRLPEIGDVHAAGATLQEFESAVVQKILDERLVISGKPRVAVSLEQGRGFLFTIDGQVGTPNEYQITKSDFRLRSAIAMAGGAPPTTKQVTVTRYEDALADAQPRPTLPLPEVQPTTIPKPVVQPTPTKPLDIDAILRGLEGGESATTPATPEATVPAAPSATIEPPATIEPEPPALQPDAPSLPAEPTPTAPGAMTTPMATQDMASGLSIPQAQDLPVNPGQGDSYRYPGVELDNTPVGFVFDPQSQRWVRTETPPQGPQPVMGGDEVSLDSPRTPGAEAFGVPTRVIEIEYSKLVRGDPIQNIVIRPGDYIYVEPPPIGVVYIGGEVLRPGVYQLPSAGELTLSRVIDAAGGFGAIAVPEKVDLTRRIEGRREATIRMNLAAIRRRTEPDIILKPDDHILIGTDFWATPLAVFRNGLRMTYGFGFLLDRNFGNDVFGPPPNSETVTVN